MASSIPRSVRKGAAAQIAALSLKVAFFTEIAAYNELTATTYTELTGICTEVSSSGTGYVTGGYALTGKASANLATNGAIMTAAPTSASGVSFTARYGVIYDTDTDAIWGVSDWLASYPVTNGTITITWDNTNGLFRFE
jgi:hypothetical protein